MINFIASLPITHNSYKNTMYLLCIYHITSVGICQQLFFDFVIINKKTALKMCGFNKKQLFNQGLSEGLILSLKDLFMSENDRLTYNIIKYKHNYTSNYFCDPQVHIKKVNACPHHKCLDKQSDKTSAIK